MDNQDIKNLKKRYLVWLYKTTKEELDRIERKFTQLDIDKFILKELTKQNTDKKLERFIEEFREYIKHKENEGLTLKYENQEISPGFLFLETKLKAIEEAIINGFDKDTLKEIKSLYEKEMIERILKGIEHK